METKEILQQCKAEGNVVKLPSIQLERKQYLDVKKHLELIGGKWKGGKVQGFVFEQDPASLLEQIALGEKRNLKKEYQFFETPDRLADRLVELAKISYNDSILEPSAGRGAIVEAIHRKHPEINVFGYELMELNQSFLAKLDHFKLLGSDFLTECDASFDVIIANPPFSKNQDIDHIYKMLKRLNPGGRLVSIASKHWQFAQGKKETAFRDWIIEAEADVYGVDRGEFKESDTMIEACIIVVQC
jgi:type I restriction-modification system DNA methylase subunit